MILASKETSTHKSLDHWMFRKRINSKQKGNEQAPARAISSHKLDSKMGRHPSLREVVTGSTHECSLAPWIIQWQKSFMKMMYSEFQRKVRVVEEQQEKKKKRHPMLTGRKIAVVMYALFQINDVQGRASGMNI